ncbi:MAG: hydantoinase B/oxoprolinase family protein [Paracoccaceae bacterium]|nr:hydantoinase B/oxoprolinase family protein [Paracoccaceae bacterium]
MVGLKSKNTSDGVQMALLSSRMESIARKMQNTLFRTARSGVLNTAHDFSCVILTADCQLLASAESLPIHVMIGPDLICETIKKYHPDLKRGDAFLHNSPYEGNSHAADHCMVVPIFDDNDKHRFFVLAKAHQADCGNSVPTTYVGHAQDVYDEGALIFTAVKIQDNYKNNDDIIRMCKSRIRVPDQWWGDYLASMGAVRIGEREIEILGTEIGWGQLEKFSSDWFDYSEQRMIQAISKLPSGSIVTSSTHDPFPGVPDGITAKVKIKIDSKNSKIFIDLTDNPDCQPCGLNLTEGTATSAAMIGIFNGIVDHTVPPNAGSFRRIEIKLRENCCTGIPRHPVSCSVATTNLADRVLCPVQVGIAELAEGYGQAETGPIIPAGMGVISGNDPRKENMPFVNQIFLGITGGAGTPVTDGFLTIIHAGNAGLCRQDSIEVDELQYPIHVSKRYVTMDTEGAGKFRGSPSAYCEFGPIDDCSMKVLYTSDGSINPAKGARGGQSGGVAKTFKKDPDGKLTELPNCYGLALEPGEMVASYSAGGGGYGNPKEREIERVFNDYKEGWISKKRAETVYGVLFDKNDQVDFSKTEELRKKF